MNDSRVDHVLLAPISGGYSFDPEVFTESGLWLDGRSLLVEGQGPERVYVDVSMSRWRLRGAAGLAFAPRALE